MSAAKTLSNVRARAEEGERYQRTGRVELYALPDWLKGDRFVQASLSPSEARRLAIQLLEAAENAEAAR